MFFFFFKQKTAYEMRISDWSSDVCSSDLHEGADLGVEPRVVQVEVLADDAVEHAQEPDHQQRQRGDAVAAVDAAEFRQHGAVHAAAQQHGLEIGRASCRERVCKYG